MTSWFGRSDATAASGTTECNRSGFERTSVTTCASARIYAARYVARTDRPVHRRQDDGVLQLLAGQLQLSRPLFDKRCLVVEILQCCLVASLGTSVLDLGLIKPLLRDAAVLDQRFRSLVTQAGLVERRFGLPNVRVPFRFEMGAPFSKPNRA